MANFSTIEDIILYINASMYVNFSATLDINDFDVSFISNVSQRILANKPLTVRQASAAIKVIRNKLKDAIKIDPLDRQNILNLLVNPQYRYPLVDSIPISREVRNVGFGILVFRFPNNPAILEQLKNVAISSINSPELSYRKTSMFFGKYQFMTTVRVDSLNAHNVLEFIKRHKFSCDDSVMQAIAEAIDNTGKNTFLKRDNEKLTIQNSGNIVLDSTIGHFLLKEIEEQNSNVLNITPALIRKFKALHDMDPNFAIGEIFPEQVPDYDQELRDEIPDSLHNSIVESILPHVQYLKDYDYRAMLCLTSDRSSLKFTGRVVSDRCVMAMMATASVNKTRPIILTLPTTASFKDIFHIKGMVGKWFPNETVGGEKCDWILSHNDKSTPLKISPLDVKQHYMVIDASDPKDGALYVRFKSVKNAKYIFGIHDSMVFMDFGFEASPEYVNGGVVPLNIGSQIGTMTGYFSGFFPMMISNMAENVNFRGNPDPIKLRKDYTTRFYTANHITNLLHVCGINMRDFIVRNCNKIFLDKMIYCTSDYTNDGMVEQYCESALTNFANTSDFSNSKDYFSDILLCSGNPDAKKFSDAYCSMKSRESTEGTSYLSISHEDILGFEPERPTLLIVLDGNFTQDQMANYSQMIKMENCMVAFVNALSPIESDNIRDILNGL